MYLKLLILNFNKVCGRNTCRFCEVSICVQTKRKPDLEYVSIDLKMGELYLSYTFFAMMMSATSHHFKRLY